MGDVPRTEKAESHDQISQRPEDIYCWRRQTLPPRASERSWEPVSGYAMHKMWYRIGEKQAREEAGEAVEGIHRVICFESEDSSIKKGLGDGLANLGRADCIVVGCQRRRPINRLHGSPQVRKLPSEPQRTNQATCAGTENGAGRANLVR